MAFGLVDVESKVRKMYVTVPGGQVSEVLVKEGDSVAAGTVLVRLDDAQARHRVDEAKAAADEAKAALDRGRSLPDQHRIEVGQAEAAIRVAESLRNAAKTGLENKQRLQNTNTIGGDAVTLAQEELRQAENGLRIKQDELRKLRLMDPKLEVKVLEAQVGRAEAVLGRPVRRCRSIR